MWKWIFTFCDKKNFINLNLYGLEPNDKLRKLTKKRFNQKKVRVFKGDLRKIKTSLKEKFDILICQRVIINILNYSDQKKALNNIKKLMKKNGIPIFMESFKDGLRNLNMGRKEFNLKPIKSSYHNLYLKSNFFKISGLRSYNDANKIINQYPLSKHHYISRVIHDLFIKITKTKFERNSKFVQFFSNSINSNFVNFSQLKFKVLEKR